MADSTNNTIIGIVKDTNKTDKGTPIVRNTGGMDKNSFLKILVAQLSNQDPTQPKDTTAYIAQLAQFSSLEQMTNLNGSVTFSNAASLVGKTVYVTDTDSQNVPFNGQVLAVSKNGDLISLTMKVTDSFTKITEIKKFDFKKITDVATTTIETTSDDKAADTGTTGTETATGTSTTTNTSTSK